ncbi:MAG: DUF58 domain-containing protein [Pseudomonadota bacterium]
MRGLVARLNLQRFFIGEGPQSGEIILTRRRIYILPTRSGMIFGFILFAMLLAAMNYNNSMAHALTFLLASLAVVSILHGYRNLHGLRFTAGRSAGVFAGERLSFPVQVSNPDGRRRPAIKIGWPREAPLCIDLPPAGGQWVHLERPATRRGRHTMGRFTVYTRYPLGLFHAWSHLEFDRHGLVYPTPAAAQPFPHTLATETEESNGQGRGVDDFAGLRAYAPGDSLRHVHWKTLAKERGVMTKQFAGGQAPELIFAWDLLNGMDTEARLSMLCRWVLDAERLGLRYGLHLPQAQLPVDSGAAHRHQCLTALALFGQQD